MPPRSILAFLAALVFVNGSHAAGSNTVQFAGDWETGNISQWTWGAQCANYGLQSSGGIARGNVYVIDSPVSQGVYGSRFDLPASSDRTACEVLRKRTLNLGADEYYGLDIRFPSDWQEPSPHGWGMAIGQFNYQGIWGPPLGLFAHRDHVKLVMQSGWCRDVYSSNPGCTYSSGIGGNVPITYAIPSSRFSAGTWHQLIVHVRWTNTSTGVLEAWHRRRGESSWVKTVNQTGYPTVQWSDTYSVTSDHTTTDKIGAYRGPASFTTSIWHDAFVIGTTFDTVAQQLNAGGKATVTPSTAPPAAPSAAPPSPPPALSPAESLGEASTPEATETSPEAAPATSAESNSAVAATPANRQISREKIRAASRVVIRFRSGFAGRAIGLRRTTDTPRPKSMVILYHRAPSGWRVFAVQPLTRQGAFRIEKRLWSRRSTLRFRAVVAVGGTTRISSGVLALRRVGPGRSSFAQARPAQR